MNFIKTKGLIINKQDIGEADRIITVFSEKFGKINMLLNGIRKSKRRDKNAADILTLSNFTFYRKGENYILSVIDSIDSFYELKKDIEKVQIVSYILSIVNEIVLPGVRKRDFFTRVIKCLYFVENNSRCRNYLLLLKMMSWIIKNEGYQITIEGEKYFDISDSTITNRFKENIYSLNPNLFYILNSVEKREEINLTDKNIESYIKDVILLYEKYLNYHLDMKLDLKRYLLEEKNVTDS